MFFRENRRQFARYMHIERPGLIIADQWKDYQLLDCGDGMKHEKWGPYTLVRPDPQIIWPRSEVGKKWEGWDGFYHRSETGGGKWEYKKPLPDHWTVRYGALTFKIHPTSFIPVSSPSRP
jgi:23S rRNA (cytosine1962-C5)-methyltransferase